MYEVELKAHIRDIDLVKEQLDKLGFKGVKIDFIDLYLEHPCRKFEELDEELRIRYDRISGTTKITYKGKSILNDRSARNELEIEASNFEKAKEIFENLGFNVVITKNKKGWLLFNGKFEITLVSVSGDYKGKHVHLGEFIEVERKVLDPDEIESARNEILDFLNKLLGVGDIEIKYYTELIIEKSGIM